MSKPDVKRRGAPAKNGVVGSSSCQVA